MSRVRRCPEAGKAPMKIPVGSSSQRDLLGHFRGARSLVRRGREAKPSLCSWNWLLKLWRVFGTRGREGNVKQAALISVER